ncbi:MAG: hypothetical protein NTW32_24140 [Chloroflexi bacterium]|nr:hypothetical protein [Chloroflexota bacterium]
MKKILFVMFLFVFLISACSPAASGPAKAELPAGMAFEGGKVVYFIHTEASDADIADKLTGMMKSPVLYVPSLADVPKSALANVYVFTNGSAGNGPLGFQSDVFDNPPGTPGYSPLRWLNTVTWSTPTESFEIKSANDILSAQSAGKLIVTQPGVVINMPFIVWEGGKR